MNRKALLSGARHYGSTAPKRQVLSDHLSISQ